MSRDAVAVRLSQHVRTASVACPTLMNKNVSPHILRHTAAMRLLAAGIDTTVIALWLGHSDSRSTQAYLHADMTQKRRTLELGAPTPQAAKPFKPSDRLLRFLEEL